MSSDASIWPVQYEDVVEAERRIRPFLPPTPLRRYARLDEEAGIGAAILVKHENHNPTNAFKVRNALSVLTALSKQELRKGVVGATRGNHGLGLAWSGQKLGVSVTVCVPLGNSLVKNAAIRGLGARLIEEGRDYDESIAVANRLVREEGLRLVHSSNEPLIIAGAGTLALEILRERPDLDALVVPVGGGSQAVGALTVARTLRPGLKVYGVQAAGASAIHDSWHAGKPIQKATADTFADGLATRSPYALTFEAMREGLAGFVTVTDAEIAQALRLLLRTTQNLAEGAGAAALAGARKLRDELGGKTIAVILSGGNIDESTLRRVLNREI